MQKKGQKKRIVYSIKYKNSVLYALKGFLTFVIKKPLSLFGYSYLCAEVYGAVSAYCTVLKADEVLIGCGVKAEV